MTTFLRHPLAAAAAFLLVFALSRAAFVAAGLSPAPWIVAYHWQHADIALLEADPVGTLWRLHAQPPLWNGVIAAFAQITGPDPAGLTSALHAFNLLLSASVGLMALSIARMSGLGPVSSITAACAVVMFPSVIYYENLAFYPQLTYALVTAIIWLLVRLNTRAERWPVYGVLAALAALAWTWALFHPLFIAIFAAGLVAWRGRERGFIAAVVAAVLLSALPTMKNAAVFGIPSASSWIGLNLAQTAPSLDPADGRACNFHNFALELEGLDPDPGVASLDRPTKSLGGANLNHHSMIARSQTCLIAAKSGIMENLPAWAAGRIAALAASHQKRPFNYETDPVGWSRVFAPMLEMQNALGPIARSASIGFYALIWFTTLRQLYRRPDALTALLMLTIVYITIVTHIANGAEQERMRYTIEPIYLLLAMRSFFGWLSERVPLARHTPPSNENITTAT